MPPNIIPNPTSQKAGVPIQKSIRFFTRILPVFLLRVKPASHIANPACIKKTIAAPSSTQIVLTDEYIFHSSSFSDDSNPPVKQKDARPAIFGGSSVLASVSYTHLDVYKRQIIAYVVEHPQKLSQIRKFMNYYLPTTLKLLNAYDRMGSAGVSGTNIDGTMGKIETMMDTVTLSLIHI